MTFSEWKVVQEGMGHLAPTKRKDCVCYPYTSKVGFGVKYQKFTNNAAIKGVECTLTFDEYLWLCMDANISPDDIGTSMASYQMGRHGDVGGYNKGNCRFILRSVNMEERTLNGGSKRQADKIRGVKNPSNGDVHRGTSNYRFVGYYVTPMGEFVTTEEAANANGCAVMTVYDRCKRCDRVVSKYATSTLKLLGSAALGKTYRELGWSFREVDYDAKS